MAVSLSDSFSAPPLTAAVAAIFERIKSAPDNFTVIGVPGSGKSRLAMELLNYSLTESHLDALAISPNRQSAQRLNRLLRQITGQPSVGAVNRSFGSLAFHILGLAAVRAQSGFPVLMSAASQDALLRDLLSEYSANGTGPLWDGLHPEASALPGFRYELQNLLMRAQEGGLTSAGLTLLGRQWSQKRWVQAAQVLRDYEDIVAIKDVSEGNVYSYDPASIIPQATAYLRSLESWQSGGLPDWGLIIVDDLQDANIATADLLRELHRLGARIVAFGNADQTVQAFRGAVPSILGLSLASESEGGWRATRLELTQNLRQHPALAELVRRFSSTIPVVASGSPRASAGATADFAMGSHLQILRAPNARGQVRAIARELRRARHGGAIGATDISSLGPLAASDSPSPAIPWSQMAVISRSRSFLAELRPQLEALDIPCREAQAAMVLSAQPAVRALLELIEFSFAPEWGAATFTRLLSSRICGVERAALRQLQQQVARRYAPEIDDDLSGGLEIPRPTESELPWRTYLDSLVQQGGVAGRDFSGRAAVAHQTVAKLVRTVLNTAKAIAAGMAPADVLWAAWDVLALAEDWQQAALQGNSAAEQDLDAVLALFYAAEKFFDEYPQTTVRNFIHYVDSQEFAVDILAPRGQVSNAVTLTTPMAAMGETYAVVVVPDLQEGQWPNLRIRDGVLQAGLLQRVVSGRAGDPRDVQGIDFFREARAEVVADEARLFLQAISRAQSQLVLLSVVDAENLVSRFITEISELAQVEPVDVSYERFPADIRELVASLRFRVLRAAQVLPNWREDAQVQADLSALSWLQARGVPGADPQTWPGAVPLSTTAAMWEEDDRLRFSPSGVATGKDCALRWALEGNGARDANPSPAQDVGKLIHALAELSVRNPGADLQALFAHWWEQNLGVPETYLQAKRYGEVEAMVQRLNAYIAATAAEAPADRDGSLFAEVKFQFQLDEHTEVRGVMDRIDARSDLVNIVDFKTGKTAPTKAEVASHPQLSLYQLAVAKGAVANISGPAAAELVMLGKDSDKLDTIRLRQGSGAEVVAEQLLTDLVEQVRRPSISASPGKHCQSCRLAHSCPAQPQGRQLSDEF